MIKLELFFEVELLHLRNVSHQCKDARLLVPAISSSTPSLLFSQLISGSPACKFAQMKPNLST
jgi:hypothetical protein